MTNEQCVEDSRAGMRAEFDILMYLAVSMDTNPAYPDIGFARQAWFAERIGHGTPPARLISAVLGKRLSGPGSLYMRRGLRFAAPVRIGQTVTATIEVPALAPKAKRPTAGDAAAIDGEAFVQVPSRG